MEETHENQIIHIFFPPRPNGTTPSTQLAFGRHFTRGVTFNCPTFLYSTTFPCASSGPGYYLHHQIMTIRLAAQVLGCLQGIGHGRRFRGGSTCRFRQACFKYLYTCYSIYAEDQFRVILFYTRPTIARVYQRRKCRQQCAGEDERGTERDVARDRVFDKIEEL